MPPLRLSLSGAAPEPTQPGDQNGKPLCPPLSSIRKSPQLCLLTLGGPSPASSSGESYGVPSAPLPCRWARPGWRQAGTGGDGEGAAAPTAGGVKGRVPHGRAWSLSPCNGAQLGTPRTQGQLCKRV